MPNNSTIKQTIAELRQSLQENPGGPDARTTTLIHAFTRQCRTFVGANDMTGLNNYLTEIDSQATQLGESVSYARTGTAGGQQAG